jgi:hypothetical protein
VFLLCATGRPPTAMAAVLFCARSRGYRIVRLSHAAQLGCTVDEEGLVAAPVRPTVLRPWSKRTVDALLKASPQALGWGRPRWSWATLACALQAQHRLEVSAGTGRRWLHAAGWGWKRAKVVAKENAPQRVERLARMRWPMEPWQAHALVVWADALAIPLGPKVGAAWRPRGRQEAVMTPGQNAQPSRAGALHRATGTIRHGRGPRKHHGVCRDLLTRLARTDPEPQGRRISGVVDHDKMHKATAVAQGWAAHPRCAWQWVPTSGPRANPRERACGDGHATGPRNHQRTRLCAVVSDGERHLGTNGPWVDKVSRVDQEPEVTAVVERITAEGQAKRAA